MGHKQLVAALQRKALRATRFRHRLPQIDRIAGRIALCIASCDVPLVGAELGDPAGLGQQIENRGIGIDGIAAGRADLAEHRDALAARLDHVDIDVRIDEVAAVLQRPLHFLRRFDRRQPGDLHLADERHADAAVVAHVDRAGHIRLSVDLDAHRIARTQTDEPLVGGAFRSRRRRRRRGLGRCLGAGGRGQSTLHENGRDQQQRSQ